MQSLPRKSNSTTHSLPSSSSWRVMCSTRSEQQPTVSAVSPSSFSLPALSASLFGGQRTQEKITHQNLHAFSQHFPTIPPKQNKHVPVRWPFHGHQWNKNSENYRVNNTDFKFKIVFAMSQKQSCIWSIISIISFGSLEENGYMQSIFLLANHLALIHVTKSN